MGNSLSNNKTGQIRGNVNYDWAYLEFSAAVKKKWRQLSRHWYGEISKIHSVIQENLNGAEQRVWDSDICVNKYTYMFVNV